MLIQESPLQSCFYTWLYTALCHDEDCKKYIESHFHCRVSAISTDDIENIMLFAVQKKKILLLWQGIQFYIPVSLESIHIFDIHVFLIIKFQVSFFL